MDFTILRENIILIENLKYAIIYDFTYQRLYMSYFVHYFTYRITGIKKTKILFS